MPLQDQEEAAVQRTARKLGGRLLDSLSKSSKQRKRVTGAATPWPHRCSSLKHARLRRRPSGAAQQEHCQERIKGCAAVGSRRKSGVERAPGLRNVTLLVAVLAAGARVSQRRRKQGHSTPHRKLKSAGVRASLASSGPEELSSAELNTLRSTRTTPPCSTAATFMASNPLRCLCSAHAAAGSIRRARAVPR